MTFLPASREIVWPIAVRDVIQLGAPRFEAHRAADLLALLDLSSFADRAIGSLSTGERSRVLLARALAPEPKLLLLDEPLSNMDPQWVLRTIELLRAVTEESRCSAILALHDLHQLDRFDRVLVMHEGRLAIDGPPADVLNDRSMADIFGIQQRQGRWEIRRRADPQSSP